MLLGALQRDRGGSPGSAAALDEAREREKAAAASQGQSEAISSSTELSAQ